jgi:hypothetical protein
LGDGGCGYLSQLTRALSINLIRSYIMAKIYEGNVSVFQNTKGKIVVKADPEGQYNAENVSDLTKVMTDVGRIHKAEVNFFIPEGSLGDKNLTPMLLTNRWGSPYVAFLPERTGNTASKAKPVKLA